MMISSGTIFKEDLSRSLKAISTVHTFHVEKNLSKNCQGKLVLICGDLVVVFVVIWSSLSSIDSYDYLGIEWVQVELIKTFESFGIHLLKCHSVLTSVKDIDLLHHVHAALSEVALP